MTTEPSLRGTPRGPVVFGYDGSSAAERAICLMAPLLSPKRALVVTVCEAGVGYVLLTPTIAPAPIDIRAKLEVDEALYERARQLAEQGATTARQLGLDAEGLAVADVLTPADTLVRIARDRNAAMVVVGSHGHRGVRELLMGSTTRAVIRVAPCPVGVVRHDEHDEADADAPD